MVAYTWPLNDRTLPGRTIKIGGRLPIYAKNVKINFESSCCNIAFQMRLKYEENKLVVEYNSFINGAWGARVQPDLEDVPIERGGDFSITIVCDEDKFKITVDGNETTFDHRMPPSRISHIRIEGDITLSSLSVS